MLGFRSLGDSGRRGLGDGLGSGRRGLGAGADHTVSTLNGWPATLVPPLIFAATFSPCARTSASVIPVAWVTNETYFASFLDFLTPLRAM